MTREEILKILSENEVKVLDELVNEINCFQNKLSDYNPGMVAKYNLRFRISLIYAGIIRGIERDHKIDANLAVKFLGFIGYFCNDQPEAFREEIIEMLINDLSVYFKNNYPELIGK